MPRGPDRGVIRGSPYGRLLAVFARFPEPGLVKTRLIPALGPAGAAELQRAMTERTLQRVASPPAGGDFWETLVRFDGGDSGRMASWLGASRRCLSQGPGDLGERMQRAFGEGFASGVAAMVVIGSDCPGIGAADVADAFGALARHDVVFGPARDGGYWLIGLRCAAFPAAAGPLFTGPVWGGSDVLAASCEAARRAGLGVGRLRTLADVDRPDDLAIWEAALRDDAAGAPISVVVPALNEDAAIGVLMAELDAAAGVEVVVADGGSDDQTAAAAAASGARVVDAGRGRAIQMNTGAAAAAGEILLFLHADTRLASGWEAAVRGLLSDPLVLGGAFSLAIDSPRRRLRSIEAAANWRARRLGVVFGDQAIFVRREAFTAIGGFPLQPLMEDYEFVRRLRRLGKMVLLPQKALTSARRWERRGPLRNSLGNALITLAYLAGVSPQRLAAWYR